MEQQFEMMVNNQGEEDFFLGHLKKNMRVLEYGSGASTLAIAKRVKQVVSIEHNKEWYEKMKSQVPKNVTLLYVPPNSEPKPEYDDGTYSDFFNYVNEPAHWLIRQQGTNLFDLIFIDGRARVACAEACKSIGHKKAIVFIHDYNHPNPKYLRSEYFEAEKYLIRKEGVFTMYKFAIRWK